MFNFLFTRRPSDEINKKKLQKLSRSTTFEKLPKDMSKLDDSYKAVIRELAKQ
ncbi:MAG: hypothetical protein KBD00_01325 [Candidatus Peribacteraceae bacterium]|nr:hypothetical protein [Candidatus Peribacteraceae bacterium]